ncbi:hypothetical protein ACFODZ_16605 [Marinicella sediminis]|uniref:Toxic anion resistance protein n=1 Tax=Marinicella sediminis TaxID=1792834 RepID=A0ABV7JFJ3_9GAMM|nr:hypothetical protein [Marinicella sediminis]
MTESLPVHLPSLQVPVASDDANSEAGIAQLLNDWSVWLRQMDPHDLPLVQQVTDALLELGMTEQQAFWALDEGLKLPLEQHLSSGLTADSVHDLLQELQQYIRSITPPKNKRPSLIEQLKLLFSSHLSPWDLWLEHFSDQQQDIKALSARLERGLGTLNGENQVMASHQMIIRQHISQLQKVYDLAVALGKGFGELLTALSADTAAVCSQIEQEFLPVIQKRVIELQQQLLMARQADLTFDMLIKQNQHLSRDITVAMNNSQQILEVTAGLVVARRRNHHGKQQSMNQHSIQLADIRKAQLQEAQEQIKRALEDIEQVKEDARQSHQYLLKEQSISTENQV